MNGPQVIDAVREARAHVGVVAAEEPPPGLDVVSLRTVGQVVVLPSSHRLANKKVLHPRDLSGERIVVAPTGSPHRTMLSQAFGAAGAEWQVAVEATGWELMLQFARYGLGIAVVNDFCPPPRGMLAVPLEGVSPVTYYLLRRVGLRTRQAEAMHQLILETARGEGAR
jgi:DNA-binding transcriptional LysR family regulator